MPLYLIDRDYSGYADADPAALSLRVQGCAARFPNMRWIRSFDDPTTQTSVCLYEADNPHDLEQHALLAGISCERVREVIEWTPANLDDVAAAQRDST